MAAVGVLMLVTAALLHFGRGRGSSPSLPAGRRDRGSVTWKDAALTGIAQGFAALPGLSRSGLTLAALLGRGIDRGDALTMSFLLSIPVSIGAGVFAGLRSGAHASPEAIAALAAAAAVGFFSIRGLLKVARRVNFGLFVAVAGVVVMAGGLWQALG